MSLGFQAHLEGTLRQMLFDICVGDHFCCIHVKGVPTRVLGGSPAVLPSPRVARSRDTSPPLSNDFSPPNTMLWSVMSHCIARWRHGPQRADLLSLSCSYPVRRLSVCSEQTRCGPSSGGVCQGICGAPALQGSSSGRWSDRLPSGAEAVWDVWGHGQHTDHVLPTVCVPDPAFQWQRRFTCPVSR